VPGHSLRTAPPALADFLRGTVCELRDELGERLVAVVLHGSLAMGAFYPPKSDLDLLVLATDLGGDARIRLWRLLERRHRVRPFAAGLEVSAIRAADAAAPRHPLPYLAHFSETTSSPDLVSGPLPSDPDLIAHLAVARQRGVSLFGPPPGELIGPVARADYLAAVRCDIDWLLEGEAILQSPRYGVLNLCRWAMLSAGAKPDPPGKEEAALWALENAPPAHHALIARALAAQRSDAPVGPGEDLRLVGGPWGAPALLAFRDWTRRLPPPI